MLEQDFVDAQIDPYLYAHEALARTDEQCAAYYGVLDRLGVRDRHIGEEVGPTKYSKEDRRIFYQALMGPFVPVMPKTRVIRRRKNNAPL